MYLKQQHKHVHKNKNIYTQQSWPNWNGNFKKLVKNYSTTCNRVIDKMLSNAVFNNIYANVDRRNTIFITSTQQCFSIPTRTINSIFSADRSLPKSHFLMRIGGTCETRSTTGREWGGIGWLEFLGRGAHNTAHNYTTYNFFYTFVIFAIFFFFAVKYIHTYIHTRKFI